MPSTEALLGFALASAILIAVPGPSVLFAIARSLSIGRRGGVVTVLGNTLGQIPLILAVAFGVGAIVAQSIVLFTAVKLLGAAYLVYLGVQAIRHRNDADGAATDPAEASAPLRTVFWEGFVVGVTNPKSIVFFLAVLPQFATPASGSVPLQMVVLGLVFIAIALISDTCYALLAGSARTWLGGSRRRMALVRGGGGTLMVGLGVGLAVTGKSS